MKISAPASCGPTREIALLIADARPACRPGTERIKAVVSGATMIEIPMPKMSWYGSTSVRYPLDGSQVAGSEIANCHGDEVAGMRAIQRSPIPITIGPAVMNSFGPYLLASAPKRVERKIRKSEPGIA